MKIIGSVLFFSMLMFFSACNNMPNNSTVSDKQNVPDKPCSSEAVKNQVLSMFSSNFVKNGYSEDFLAIKFIKDSIDDITSTPINNNSCNCEATIYFYFRVKDTWSSEQKAQDWYKKTVAECDSLYSRGGHIYHATNHDIINWHTDNKHYPDNYGDVQFKQSKITYKVKTTDEGKTIIELNGSIY